MTKHKKRILHVLHGLPIGGAELLVIHYIRALGMDDFDHFVFSFGPDGPVRNILEGMGVNVRISKDRDTIMHPLRFISGLLTLIYNLKQFVETNQIDIIQSHTGHANELSILVGKICNIPTFPTFHTTGIFVSKKSGFRIGSSLLKFVDHIIFRCADRIVTVSVEISSLLQRQFNISPKKIVVIKNGIFLDDNKPFQKRLLKNPSGSEPIIITAVGRLVPLKAFDTLIKAAFHLKEMGLKKFLIRIVGEGPDADRLKSMISDLHLGSNVKLPGLNLDVLSILRTTDIFVIPSRFEGLSLAMIEAMACGLPIIASDAPGLRDHIQHNQTGLIFPVDDDNALSECLFKLSKNHDLRSKLSIQSKIEFDKHYNMKSNIESLKTLINEFCAS